MLNILIFILSVIVYFGTLWFFPWESLPGNGNLGGISATYLLDILIISIGWYYLKFKAIGDHFKISHCVAYSVISLIFSSLCILTINFFELSFPFRFLDLLFFKILILAPFIEELVFRGFFFELASKLKLKPKMNLLLNSSIFSFSHIIALWYISEEFHHFVYFQLFYTFVLGLLCSVARHKSGGVVAPIIIHFLFNLVFYFKAIG